MIVHRFDDEGRYTTSIHTTQAGADMEDQTRIFIGEADSRTQYHDISAGHPVDMPSRPSPNHTFDYTIKQWRDPRTPQDHIAATRSRRDALLLASDWTQLPDVTLANKQAWATYRQALRDITNQPNPLAIEWPVQPF